MCLDGGIGRHIWLKIKYPFGCASSSLVQGTKDNVRVLVCSHINDEVIRIKRGTILDTQLTLSIASIAQLVRAPDC